MRSSRTSTHGVLQPNSIAAGVAHGTEPRTPQNRTSMSEWEDDIPGIGDVVSSWGSAKKSQAVGGGMRLVARCSADWLV